MKNIHLHSVVINRITRELMSADTDFYAFIEGDSLYKPFDELLHPDYREGFLKLMEKADDTKVIVGMLNNDQLIMTYMKMVFDDDKVLLELESVDELKEGQELYRNLLELNYDILNLHNDLIFSYDGRTDTVRWFTPDFRRCTRCLTLNVFLEEIRERIKPDEYKKLDELKVMLAQESGSFALTFEGNIISTAKECKTSIVKGLRVDGMEEMTAVGYVHRGSNKGNATHTIEKDALTGAYSKREIANVARRTIEVEKQSNVAIAILDVDYFKKVNDRFGHMMGDKVLKEVAQIIIKEVGNGGIVGRFGGDEFFAIFFDVVDMELCREKLRSIKNMVNTTFPKSEDDSTVCVTLSIGCAVYPKDADNYDDLFCLADFCLYRAKDKGRNRYIIYTPEKHGTLSEIKDFFNNNRRIDNRKELAMSEVICMIEDKHFNEDTYTPEMLVDDLVENLSIERMICFAGDPLRYRCMSGINLPPIEDIDACAALFDKKDDTVGFVNDVLIVDDLEKIKNFNEDIYKVFKGMGTKAFILVRFMDAAGKKAFISLEMTTAKYAWNLNQTYNYRTIARMFAKYEL